MTRSFAPAGRRRDQFPCRTVDGAPHVIEVRGVAVGEWRWVASRSADCAHVVVVWGLGYAGKGVENNHRQVVVVVQDVFAAESPAVFARGHLVLGERRNLSGEGLRIGEEFVCLTQDRVAR